MAKSQSHLLFCLNKCSSMDLDTMCMETVICSL